MLKGIRIHETLDDFLEYHPELEVLLDDNGNIQSISFPSDAEKTSFTNILGEISIYYIYKGERVRFPSDYNLS